MLRLGFTNLIQRLFKKRPKQKKERIKNMTPSLTPEYLETLKQEYQYVCTCLNYSSLKFKLLTNQGVNPSVLQQVNNELVVRKTSLEVQIYAVTDYLNG